MAMVYKPKQGARIDKEQAQRYGERIAVLEENNRGNEDLPGVLIEDARIEVSPLHDYFMWDDQAAGEQFRRHQAQILLCSIEVEIVNPVSEDLEYTRAFHPVTVEIAQEIPEPEEEPETVSVWTTTQRIWDNPNWKQQIVDKALAELKSWQKKYRQYSELSRIHIAIDETRESMQPEIELAEV